MNLVKTVSTFMFVRFPCVCGNSLLEFEIQEHIAIRRFEALRNNFFASQELLKMLRQILDEPGSTVCSVEMSKIRSANSKIL